MGHRLTRDLAAMFADIALSHVAREYPAKMDHVLAGPHDLRTPSALHPAFHGSFDWHSCVHGFWLLARILRSFPELPQSARIRQLFERQLTADNLAAELDYIRHPMHDNFERPYGWAWLLMLASELRRHDTAEAKQWCENLKLLRRELSRRFERYFSRLPYPIRAGTHHNSAFAGVLAIEYAEVCGDASLLALVRDKVVTFFAADANCRPFEPSGNDFHSSVLIEMECMRRALDRPAFLAWLDRFLPELAARQPDVLFEPVAVFDHADAQFGHLDGLNFSRAWCWRGLASVLPREDPRVHIALANADAHIDQSLPHLKDDYAGEHWLATYAMLALAA
ncbi:MAG: DUF2891 domain-containing protein [Xanthobacteraceae bacterium]